MKTYLRRLWAALLGRGFTPLEMGDKISFRSPGGTPLDLEITQVSYHQEIDRVSVLTVEAKAPIHRLRVQSLCACGCGRVMPKGAQWDGMHGPGLREAT